MNDDLSLQIVLSKVKKLLRLAAGNANIHEAAAAAAKAQELIDRYKLELGELEGEGIEVIDSPEEPLYQGRRAVKWKEILALRLAHANGCHVWVIQPSAALKKEGYHHKVKVVGKPSNVEILRYLFGMLVAKIESLAITDWRDNRNYWVGRGVNAQGHALDFKLGAGRAIGDRLKEERKRVVDEHRQLKGETQALVRFENEAAEAAAWLEENLGNELAPRPTKTQAGNDSAFAAGYRAGQGIVMSKALKGGSGNRQLPS